MLHNARWGEDVRYRNHELPAFWSLPKHAGNNAGVLGIKEVREQGRWLPTIFDWRRRQHAAAEDAGRMKEEEEER